MEHAHQVQPYDVSKASLRTQVGARSSAAAPIHQPARAQSGDARINVHHTERLVSALTGSLAVALGLAQRSTSGKALALLGSALVYRGVSGQCHVYRALGVSTAEGAAAARLVPAAHARHYDVLRAATVQKSPDEVYRAWREPEFLARVMSHFATLSSETHGRTRWIVRDPLGREHDWETHLVDDQANQRLRWATPEGSKLVKAVTLTLRPAPGDRGTEMGLQVRIEPSGALAAVLSKLLGPAPGWLAERALANAKCLLEAGELPSLAHNPAARRRGASRT